jgi:hypothetical protein
MSVGAEHNRHRDLTVARVRDQPALDYVEVMFLESARIYRLSKSHERFEQLLARLRHAEAGGEVSRVTLATPESGDIVDVENA